MGTRAVQALKPIFAALKMIYAGDVTIPLTFVPVVDGKFSGNEVLKTEGETLLKELAKLTPVYQALHQQS
jgi:NAD(P)H-dependent FMN reductase